jgi:hypothetical protein
MVVVEQSTQSLRNLDSPDALGLRGVYRNSGKWFCGSTIEFSDTTPLYNERKVLADGAP